MLSHIRRTHLAVLAIMLIILPMHAFAGDLNAANTSWVLTSTALVLFMTIPGLSLFYGGIVRSKNVLSVLMQCFAITCLASIIWFAFGYSLAFGDGGSMTGLLWMGLAQVLVNSAIWSRIRMQRRVQMPMQMPACGRVV